MYSLRRALKESRELAEREAKARAQAETQAQAEVKINVKSEKRRRSPSPERQTAKKARVNPQTPKPTIIETPESSQLGVFDTPFHCTVRESPLSSTTSDVEDWYQERHTAVTAAGTPSASPDAKIIKPASTKTTPEEPGLINLASTEESDAVGTVADNAISADPALVQIPTSDAFTAEPVSTGYHIDTKTAGISSFATTAAEFTTISKTIEDQDYTPTKISKSRAKAAPRKRNSALKVTKPTRKASKTALQISSPTSPDDVGKALQVESATEIVEQAAPAIGDVAIGSKPPPSGQPLVWADSRQALCETLPYYRSYQGGGYCSGGFARGFMFDKESHSRDYIDSDVVVSRAGGGLSKDKTTGAMVREADQKEGSQVLSLRNSIAQFNAVAIIVGENNPCLPCQAPQMYSVLDWFKPTHIWYEKSSSKTCIRYRFEKLRPDTPSWWAPADSEEQVRVGDLPNPVTKRCTSCDRDSMQIYTQGWMCLEPNCSDFWLLEDGNEPLEEDLKYDLRFLKQRTVWPHNYPPSELVPSLPSVSNLSISGEDVGLMAWRGIVCPQCGRCNSREIWERWECGNTNCDFTYAFTNITIPAKALHEPYYPLHAGYSMSRDLALPMVDIEPKFAHNYRINYFTIPGIDGFVAHMIANKTVNQEAGGPDDMFVELQKTDIGLRRRPLGSKMLKGVQLTQHFLVNYGMPYKFIAATASRSFDGAAKAIRDSRSQLNWASELLVKEAHTEFNEVLALGYFEKQKIDFHDDGETGLGPTIATLSLGAPGQMHLRMKAKHYHGVSKTGCYTEKVPLPGCLSYLARKTAHDALAPLKTSSPAAYKDRIKALPKELGLAGRGEAPNAISMILGHGDIVIMHGTGIQEYYEHSVSHAGKLRFALTCRYIEPDSLKEADRPEYVVGRDEGGYDGAKVPFLG